MRIDVGTIPSSLPPRKVPRTDPPAITGMKARLRPSTEKLWSRL